MRRAGGHEAHSRRHDEPSLTACGAERVSHEAGGGVLLWHRTRGASTSRLVGVFLFSSRGTCAAQLELRSLFACAHKLKFSVHDIYIYCKVGIVFNNVQHDHPLLSIKPYATHATHSEGTLSHNIYRFQE